ncbi:MAG: hypothetical protein ACYC7A_13730 [Thermoanaerobaculia bacterium]
MLICFVIALAGIACGIAIGYHLAREDDGTQFVTKRETTFLIGEQQPPITVPPGFVLYGLRDPFGEKMSRYKTYIAIYDAHPVTLERITIKGKRFTALQDEESNTRDPK